MGASELDLLTVIPISPGKDVVADRRLVASERETSLRIVTTGGARG